MIEHNNPLKPVDSVYPFNSVHQTRSGHKFEVDDTLGSETIHREHKSGTSETVGPDGSRTINVWGADVETIFKDKTLTVYGDLTINVIGGNIKMKCSGDFEVDVAGDYTERIQGNKKSWIGKSSFAEIGENDLKNIAGGITYVADQNIHINSDAASINMKAANAIGIKAEAGDLDFAAGKSTSFLSAESFITNAKNQVTVASSRSILAAGAGMQLGAASLKIASSGNTEISCAEASIIGGKLMVDQDIESASTITASTDVLGGGVSLKTHRHNGGSIPD